MTKYIIDVTCKGNWDLDNSDLLLPRGLKELKEVLKILEIEKSRYSIVIETIWACRPNGCFQDVTSRYVK